MDLLKLLPPKARAAVYLAVTLGATVYGVYTAAEGNWPVFVGNMFVALQGLLAASNIDFSIPVIPVLGLSKISDAYLLDEALNRGKVLVDGQQYQWLQEAAAPELARSLAPLLAPLGEEQAEPMEGR